MIFRKLNTTERIRAFCWAIVVIIIAITILLLSSCEPQTTLNRAEVEKMCDSFMSVKITPIALKLDSIAIETVKQDTINAYFDLKDSLNFQFLFNCVKQLDANWEKIESARPYNPSGNIDTIELYMWKVDKIYKLKVELIKELK